MLAPTKAVSGEQPGALRTGGAPAFEVAVAVVPGVATTAAVIDTVCCAVEQASPAHAVRLIVFVPGFGNEILNVGSVPAAGLPSLSDHSKLVMPSGTRG